MHFAEPTEESGCTQCLGIEAKVRCGAGPQILNHHVGAIDDELSQPLALGRIFQVHHHGALIAIEALKCGGHAAPIRRRPAARIIAVRFLDLDHVGAEIAKDLARVRRRDAVTELDDGDAA